MFGQVKNKKSQQRKAPWMVSIAEWKGHSKESEQQRKNRPKEQNNRNSLMDPKDYSKRSNIYIIGTQKERRKSEVENVLKEIMTKN